MMNAITWSTDLHQAIKALKEDVRASQKAAFSSLALSPNEKAASIKVIVEKDSSVLGNEWV